jgi:hypothetical protein
MDKDAMLAPSRFRFTDPDDIAAYGDEWITYDELSIISRRSKELVALEIEAGGSLAAIFNGLRAGTTFGEMGAAWLGLRCAGKAVKFAEFDPIVHLMEWEQIPEGEVTGKSSASDEAPTTSTTPPVSLTSLPAVE